jgi:hypothetical protein
MGIRTRQHCRDASLVVAVLCAAAVRCHAERRVHPADQTVSIVLGCKREHCAEGYPDKIPANSDIALRWKFSGLVLGANYQLVFDLYPTDFYASNEIHIAADGETFHQRLPALSPGQYSWALSVYGATVLTEGETSEGVEPHLLARSTNAFTVVATVDEAVHVPAAPPRAAAGRGRASHALQHEDSTCQMQSLRLCELPCDESDGPGSSVRGCVRAAAVPPERCARNESAPPPASSIFAMYVLNVPGEDDRWLRMLRVLEESFPPGALVHRFDTVSLEDDRIVEYPGEE